MNKHNWSTNEIDQLDFFKTMELVFDEVNDVKEEPIQYIDQVFGT